MGTLRCNEITAWLTGMVIRVGSTGLVEIVLVAAVLSLKPIPTATLESLGTGFDALQLAEGGNADVTSSSPLDSETIRLITDEQNTITATETSTLNNITLNNTVLANNAAEGKAVESNENATALTQTLNKMALDEAVHWNKNRTEQQQAEHATSHAQEEASRKANAAEESAACAKLRADNPDDSD